MPEIKWSKVNNPDTWNETEKEIETLYSQTEVSQYEIERVPEDYIVKQLFKNMIGYMMDNKLPIKITKEPNRPKMKYDPNPPTFIYKLQMNIISDKELERLKDIEQRYNERLLEKD